ncbi:MAG: L-lysine 6-transaminase [Desulfotalea sp.]|nr:MAG: L-lysine 6-transaminase [Desulfotalea sp.]
MVNADNVQRVLSKHLLADGMDIIVDLKASQGSWLVDKRNGDRYLDCFSMFASMAVGFNHPELVKIADTLGQIAIQKPANSDIYTEPMAEFLETFSRIAMPNYLPHAFFIEGGALAVENCLKAAFDWKVKRNYAAGRDKVCGQQIIHFKQAFHGRSGYTLSLTNTSDPRKTQYFPGFDWPRIINPKCTFPLTAERLQQTIKLEQQAVLQIKEAISLHGPDIAGLIIEPIQGEGGDNHFRNDFFVELRTLCDENDILFILDEIQSGIGITGKFWAHEHTSITPDLISFGKKTQVCGLLASSRLDEIKNNVFTESSRINSTFGGNLIDMVRCSAILKIMEAEQLVNNARDRGNQLLEGLEEIAQNYPAIVANARGKGLMCSFDLTNASARDNFLAALLKEKLLLVGCGDNSIRFRPHLIITKDEIDIILNTINKVITTLY